ncbi:hypothetical protein HanPI659440_Chr11g0409711 [Helianthus annuus]|nr:hypothetical protein HanPI659440_Chr11g0409711 [Helianthus annuus]
MLLNDWIESVSAIPVDGKEEPADVCVIELGRTVVYALHRGFAAIVFLNRSIFRILCFSILLICFVSHEAGLWLGSTHLLDFYIFFTCEIDI